MIYKIYDYLCAVNFEQFEWILVDDYSNDNGVTKAVIEDIKQRASFKVKSVYLEKNYFASKSAYAGALAAQYEYACILDHDDCFSEHGLMQAVSRLKEIQGSELAGICGRCLDQNGQLIGNWNHNPKTFVDSEANFRFVRKIKGEMFQFTRTELIVKYFKFMQPGYTNGFLWPLISKKFNYLYVDEVYRVYDTDVPTSFTNNVSYKTKHIKGKYYTCLKTLIVCDDPKYYRSVEYFKLFYGMSIALFGQNKLPLFSVKRGFVFNVYSVFSYMLVVLKYLMMKIQAQVKNLRK